jgi:hypothetical protein
MKSYHGATGWINLQVDDDMQQTTSPGEANHNWYESMTKAIPIVLAKAEPLKGVSPAHFDLTRY